ncbi:MAG: ribbon-helix-helix protein, CopG family [Vicinamibacteria bacterium]
MATAKIAITIPEDVLEAVDEVARGRGESRSGFISRVLRSAVKARSDRELTRRLDEIFADPAVAAEQLRVAEEMDSAGTDWSDESW